ncbi:MAG: response regulator transcription factor [Miltoncostaeaceae bacterium]
MGNDHSVSVVTRGDGRPARALVAEDDRSVREALDRALRSAGYEVRLADDGAAALAAIEAETPDVIVLDVMMPNVDGLTVCRVLRDRGDRTPVLILTARHEVSDRVAGLDAGADDYLPKPFALDELLARLRALLRRNDEGDREDAVTVGDLTLDPRRRAAARGGRPIELTKTEFALLALFMDNPGIVLTRSLIYDRIWGYDLGETSKALDVYVGYLRRKMEAGGEQRLLHTVRGVGYSLRAP